MQPARRGGKKKLITAIIMQHRPHSVQYNCDNCGKEMKKNRGCKRNKRKAFLFLNCICGTASKCSICNGKGTFGLKCCPVRFSNNTAIDRFLPYFWNWIDTNAMSFPDGRGQIYQPSKLLEAFSICSKAHNQKLELEREIANKNR